jgi:phosphoribosylamine--glycine ligase
MLTTDGPKALEFNVRFGDPETQCILPRLGSDIVEIFLAACDGRLHEIKIKWDERACVCVVIASGGYPGKYQNGYAIHGLDGINEEETMVFHAGTKNDGGTLGSKLEAAVTKAYNAVGKIEFEHMFFRRDIGGKFLKEKSVYGRH